MSIFRETMSGYIIITSCKCFAKETGPPLLNILTGLKNLNKERKINCMTFASIKLYIYISWHITNLSLCFLSSWKRSIKRLACVRRVPRRLWDCRPETSSQSNANRSTMRAKTTKSFEDNRSSDPSCKKENQMVKTHFK